MNASLAVLADGTAVLADGRAVLADAIDAGHMGGWDGGWMWFWGFAMMTLVVVLTVWLVRSLVVSGASEPASSSLDRAGEILAERYAAGELTTEQFRERSKELK